MQDYTDQDTERVRQQHAASNAHRPPPIPQPLSPPAVGRPNNALALGLIVVGLLGLVSSGLRNFGGPLGLLAPQDSGELVGAIFFLTLASCFLFFAFWRRIYGLLIPGCILAGFAAGIPLIEMTDGVAFFWGLAAGFLAIFGLGRNMFGVRSSWPIYPAVVLFAIGTIAAASQVPALFTGAVAWLPLLLIALGIYLGRQRTV